MGTVRYVNPNTNEESELEYSDEWSFMDRANYPYSDIPDNTIVYASLFNREAADFPSFRADMSGVKFYNCQLINVLIPPGNEIIGGISGNMEV